MGGPGSSPGTEYESQVLPGVIPEPWVRNSHRIPLGVPPDKPRGKTCVCDYPEIDSITRIRSDMVRFRRTQ